jgi:hypothetical protein
MMNVSVSSGRRRKKGQCPKSVWDWVEKFHLNATNNGDAFVLAALSRCFSGGENEAVELREALRNEANRCVADYNKRVAEHNNRARIAATLADQGADDGTK